MANKFFDPENNIGGTVTPVNSGTPSNPVNSGTPSNPVVASVSMPKVPGFGLALTVSDFIKSEFINLVSSGMFVSNTNSLSSGVFADISSLKENGFFIAHKTLPDAVNNKMSLIQNPNSNTLLNSSAFFIDKTRKVYRQGDSVFFEQIIKNTTSDPQKIEAVSLIKNPILYKSIIRNGNFERTDVSINQPSATAVFNNTQAIYGITNCLSVSSTLTAGANQVYYGSNADMTFSLFTSASTGAYEYSLIAKSDNSCSAYSNFQLNVSPYTIQFQLPALSSVSTSWTEFSTTGDISVSAVFHTYSAPRNSATGFSMYYDIVRLRPFPFFNTSDNFGTQLMYSKINPPFTMQPDDSFKMICEIKSDSFTISSPVSNPNPNNNQSIIL